MIQRQKGCNDIIGRDAKVWKYVGTVIDAIMEQCIDMKDHNLEEIEN